MDGQSVSVQQLLQLIEDDYSDIDCLSNDEDFEDESSELDGLHVQEQTGVKQEVVELLYMEAPQNGESEPTSSVYIKCEDTEIKEEQEENTEVLGSPIDFFRNYWTPEIFEMITEKTNLYAREIKIPHYEAATVEEIERFIGIHVVMGCIGYPRLKYYWEPKLKMDIIADNMTTNRFCKLRRSLHIANTAKTEGERDRFWKVRPLFDAIRKRCLQLTPESTLNIDEQVIPFKGHASAKHYNKRISAWGFKLFALCGSSGLCYDFILHQGTRTEVEKSDVNLFGIEASLVIKLLQRIKNKSNTRIYFNNYFSNYDQLDYMKNQDTFANSIIRLHRCRNPPYDCDTQKNMGCMEIGNKMSEKNSNIPTGYKGFKKGVERMNLLIGTYRTFVKSKKWTLRMITHALDMSLVNAWIEYKEKATKLKTDKIMDLLHFKMYVAEALILTNKKAMKIWDSPPIKRKKVHSIAPPIEEVQFDQVGHFPESDEKKFASRCRFPGCKGRTHFFCIKCKLHLCIRKSQNCFLNYHTR